MSSKPDSDEQSPERRRNRELRELLDEMVEHVRFLANKANELGDSELDYAQQRLEWLADEIWQAVLDRRRG